MYVAISAVTATYSSINPNRTHSCNHWTGRSLTQTYYVRTHAHAISPLPLGARPGRSVVLVARCWHYESSPVIATRAAHTTGSPLHTHTLPRVRQTFFLIVHLLPFAADAHTHSVSQSVKQHEPPLTDRNSQKRCVSTVCASECVHVFIYLYVCVCVA